MLKRYVKSVLANLATRPSNCPFSHQRCPCWPFFSPYLLCDPKQRLGTRKKEKANMSMNAHLDSRQKRFYQDPLLPPKRLFPESSTSSQNLLSFQSISFTCELKALASCIIITWLCLINMWSLHIHLYTTNLYHRTWVTGSTEKTWLTMEEFENNRKFLPAIQMLQVIQRRWGMHVMLIWDRK